MLAPAVFVLWAVAVCSLDAVQSLDCLNTKEAVEAMLEDSKRGDEICIASGIYTDMKILVKKSGVVLYGEVGGRVILKGSSTIKIRGSGITVKNFAFTAPLAEGNSRLIPSPIEFGYGAKGCSVYDCMIYDHAANIWVKVRGNNNEVHHCTFENKPAPQLSPEGKEVARSKIVSVSDSKMFKIRIHHNSFIRYDPDARVAKHKHGGAEAVYVKIAKDAGRDTRNLGCVVNNNYFYKIDGEEETIGIKSSGNYVYENAIEECYGGISLRHGRNNVVRNNYIQGRKSESKLDYGISVRDENHLIKDNWVMDVGQFHGIKVVGGNGPITCSACHIRAKNVTLENNTLINSILHLGKKFFTGKYRSPVDIKIKDLTVSCSKTYAMIDGYGLAKRNTFLGQPYSFVGENRFSGKKLAYSGVLQQLKPLIGDKIIWKKTAENLGDFGIKMIEKIKNEAGTSWSLLND